MPRTATELIDLLDLETIEDNLFRGRQPETTLQRVFGGQVAAQALAASTRTVPDRYEVHSVHAYFLRPGGAYVYVEKEPPHRLLRLIQPTDFGPVEASLSLPRKGQPERRRRRAS